LFREKKFSLFLLFLACLTIALSLVDIPLCNILLTNITLKES
jgi:hypothetical protein